MQFRLFRLRFRRRLRKGQKQVEGLGQQAEANLEEHFFSQINNFKDVWRFISVWILLLLILIGAVSVQLAGLSDHYQHVSPIAGGTYNEGVLGSFTNANPLYATSEADTTVSKLLFAGLFTYDAQNHLAPDLASGYDVNSLGTVYTVHLKPNLTWQDGKSLVADDVVYTYHEIEDPDVGSPLAGSWQGISVTKKDAYTIVFTLPNPLSSFPYTLTNGIVPEHLLTGIPPAELRSADFNTVHPVGAGPFKWGALQVIKNNPANAQVLIALQPFNKYNGGEPKLDSFVVHTFVDGTQLRKAFQSQQLTAADGLGSLSNQVAQAANVQQYSLILTAANMVFFNTTSPVLKDESVRQALVQGTNTAAILSRLGYATREVREPLLMGQIGYDPTYDQAAFNAPAAEAKLEADGWVTGKGGIRYKSGQALEFPLFASNTAEHASVTRELQTQWRRLGAKVDVQLQDAAELQNTLASQSYDSVLYGISIGVDPDVFVYWDSSQIDPRSTRLNLSLYKSAVADESLEAGRTRLDPTLRSIKYRPFLQDWQTEAPAVGLYQPRLLYVANEKIYGLNNQQYINSDADRFNNVQNWMIRTTKVTD